MNAALKARAESTAPDDPETGADDPAEPTDRAVDPAGV
jgi:hypothetical protein